MIELTEDERDWIADVWDEDTTASAGAFYPVVARIIAARVADALDDAAVAWHERQVTLHGNTQGYDRARAARLWLRHRAATLRAALPDDGLHDLDDVAAEFGVNLTDNEETP